MKERIFGRAGNETAAIAKRLWAIPGFNRVAVLVMRFAGGFLLSRAVVFEAYAPFGIGWLSAARGTEGIASLLGVLLGYITNHQSVGAMKYVAIAVLVYSAAIVFRGTSFASKPWFIPAVAAAVSGFVGIVFVAGQGFSVFALMLYLTELVLIAGSGYFYTLVFGEQSEGITRAVSLLVLVSTLLLAISPLTWFGILRPARIIAGVFVLYTASRSGAGMASGAGLATGCAIDMSLGYPYFSMCYGLSGFVAGVFKNTGKFITAVSYVLMGAVTVLWAGTDTLRLAAALETFMASVIFMLLPMKTGAKIMHETPEPLGKRTESAPRAQEYARRRLQQGSLAFRELYSALSGVFDKPRNDEDVASVFDRTAAELCRHCHMRGVCWDREMSNTYQALSDASGALAREGRVKPTNFPSYFSSRCVQFTRFIRHANDEMTLLLSRRRYNARLRENRVQICHQYSEMSKILSKLAEEISTELVFDEEAERRLSRELANYSIPLRVTVLNTPEGVRRVEIEGRGAGALLAAERELLLEKVSAAVGYVVGMPEQATTPDGDKLIFTEIEALKATIGIASHKKQGQSVSGDSGTWFKTSDGKVHMLLSDGMGSGAEAERQSAQAVRLLERFLRAGIEPKTALRTLNSALVLRGEEETEGFVTIDMSIVDLRKGMAKLYKQGASPTYIKRGSRVSRVGGKAMPMGLGLDNPESVDPVLIRTEPGDILVMMSDGVGDNDERPWLERLIGGYEGQSPRELASGILEQAVLHNGASDDMMVLALLLK